MSAWGQFVEGLPTPRRPQRRRPVRLVCFDLDGVLIEQESSWVAVHEHFGLNNERSLLAFLRGEISDAEFIRRDVALWRSARRDLTLAEIDQVLRRRVRLSHGAHVAIRRLEAAGTTCAIVSGGLAGAARHVADALGIRHVSANSLKTDDRGRLTGGGTVGTPLRNKARPVRRFARELGVPLGHVAAVGNSSPDISMFRACGLGIAFRPTDAFVKKHADVVLPGRSLTEVLGPILGAPPHGTA